MLAARRARHTLLSNAISPFNPPSSLALVFLAASGLLTHPAAAQTAPVLAPSTALLPPPRGDAARQLPIVLQAQRISSQADLATVAEGEVEFRRGGLVIRADRLTYDAPLDLATAIGRVRVARDGALYSGPELRLNVQRFEGVFEQPQFEFYRLGAGGSADRVELLGDSRARASNALYTSCPREGGNGGNSADEPAWVLKLQSLSLDFETQVGVAEGAVLRFLGTPIVALPSLSFPLGNQRKSGWLPPTVSIDNRSGIEIAAPFYWNIAPQRDATLSPRVITRRGLALDTEFRYLEPSDEGQVALDWLPNDRVAKRSRQAVQWLHEGRLNNGLRYRADVLRVSDDDWWKDFPNAGRSFTTRLLPTRLALEKPFEVATAQGLAYARLLHWQVLQGSDAPITAPYQRSPQVGVRLGGSAGPWQYTLETEFNRFTLPQGALAKAGRAEGDRLHLLGALSLPYRVPGGWLVPRLALNAAQYSGANGAVGTMGAGNLLLAGTAQRASRVIPSFSIDAGLELERSAQAFGRELHQTLEPRLLYVNTPYRAQSQLPVYDAAAKDFNFVSLFSDNAFSGVDRVSDLHQITAGMTTRLVDVASGAEALRLGLVQRYLLRTQRVTAQPDGTPDGAPLEQRFSDALLVGSTSVLPGWTLDAAVQYSPELSRSVRSIVGARYSPSPFRTVGGTYRLARGSSEQFEVGWQWPVWGQVDSDGRRAAAQTNSGGGGCGGTWYSVGRINYSIKDSRVTDSVLGLEYDAGCWIGRVVATRLSTGRSEATTRLGIQLELTGLSKLNVGANPLKVLKDNIVGFRLLRDSRNSGTDTPDWQPAP